jgi:deoxyribodipyrimidine photolyase-like uncharacterized protein
LLEAYYRGVCARRLAAATQDDRVEVFYLDYIVQVEAAIKALGLAREFKTEVPSIENVSFNSYLDFNKDVTHYVTMLRIRRSQRAQGYSVRFDESAKRKIHHHLDQVLEIFGRFKIKDRKREKLISRLNELQSRSTSRERASTDTPHFRWKYPALLEMRRSAQRLSKFCTRLDACSVARKPSGRSSSRSSCGER